MAETTPRLKELYNKELKAKLMKDLGLKNINQVPELKKVVVSCGVGKKREDNDKMYEFVDRLINIALPHVRDFHGVSRTAFDAQGNYNLGLKEQTVFPEITFEDAAVLHGLEMTFIIKNGSKEGSTKLLELFGMPFEKGDK